MTFLTILGVTDMICSFRLVIEGKTGIEIPESSRLEFLKKVSASNFALSDLPLLRTLLAICQKSHELSFWEVMDSFCFIRICRFGSFKNPFVMITSPKNLLYWHKQKKGFLWTMASKQLKTMEMSEASPEAWPYSMRDIHIISTWPTHKIHQEQQKHWV